MKVLQICHGYNPPFLDVGNQYARLFDGNEHHVTTLYLSGRRSDEVEQATVASRVLFFELTAKELKGLKLGVVAKLKALLRAGQFDLVICHRYKAIYLAGLSRRAAPGFTWVGVIHDFRVFSNWSRRLFVKFLGKGLNLLGVSEAIRSDIVASCPAHALRTFSLPNSVSLSELQASQYSKRTARELLGLAPDAFVIGTAGRLHPVKDQATLLKAFAKVAGQLPSVQLVLMGSGALEASLKELSAELDLDGRVVFLGQVPEGPRYFRAFDMFALSSTKEPFGMVLIEAMAADVPVISSQTGGTAEVVGDCGLLFPPGDSEQLSRLLVQAYSWSEPKRTECIEKAQHRVQQMFSTDAVRQVFWNFPFMKPFDR